MSEEAEGALDILGVLRIAPHRYPFLMVDRVLFADDTKARGLKNVTYNEPFFVGHFPERPVFPGVLMIEAIAQLGGMLVLKRPENLGKLAFFVAADNIKFRRQVTPGDQMMIEAELVREKKGVCVVEGKVTVEDELCCSGTVRFAVVDEKSRTPSVSADD